MVWPACEKAAIPFTFIAHAQDIFKFDNDRRNKLAEITAAPLCRKVFTLSRFHHDFLAARGVPRDKIVINPNAVNTGRFAGAADVDRAARPFRRVIAVHRYVAKKGLSLLIDAAALIRDIRRGGSICSATATSRTPIAARSRRGVCPTSPSTGR